MLRDPVMRAHEQEFYLLFGGLKRLGVEEILGKEFSDALFPTLWISHQHVIGGGIVVVLDDGRLVNMGRGEFWQQSLTGRQHRLHAAGGQRSHLALQAGFEVHFEEK